MNQQTVKHNDYARIMAQFALKMANHYKNEGMCSKVDTQVKKVPVMIRFNGLAQTMAFFLSKHKKNDEYYAVLKIASDWLTLKSIYKERFKNQKNPKDIVNTLTSMDSPIYRAISNELIQVFNWTRRFTTSLKE